MKVKSGFWLVFKREWIRICSSKICIWGIGVAPLLSMVILVWMMNVGLPTKIPIAVVDLDNSGTSRSLIRQLDAFPKTDIKFKSLTFSEARHEMEQMDVYAVLYIPRNFATDAASGKQPKLVYYTNNAFLITGSLLFQDLKTVSTLAAASVGLQTGTAQGLTEVELMPMVQPITIQAHPLSNPWLNYSVYLINVIVPGILLLLILMFTVSSFGSEIKAGTGPELMRLGGYSALKVSLGKILPYTIIYLLISLLYMSIFYYYNQFPLKCGFIPMFLNYVLLVLAGQGLGFAIFAIFKNYRLALSLASLMGIVSFSIAGFSFPVLAMSPTLQGIANLFPLRHFFLNYVDMALNGRDFGYAAYHYAALLGFVLYGCLFFKMAGKTLMKEPYEG